MGGSAEQASVRRAMGEGRMQFIEFTLSDPVITFGSGTWSPHGVEANFTAKVAGDTRIKLSSDEGCQQGNAFISAASASMDVR
jgi:hypothetical protein